MKPFATLIALTALTTQGGCLMIGMPGRSHAGPLPPLSDEQSALAERLRAHVEALAVEIGERHVWRPQALADAAEYIEAQLRGDGDDTIEQQRYTASGHEVYNLERTLPGGSRADQLLVVGAHYDSIPDCPAANDNASGVAALLELTRLLEGRPRARTIKLVAFVNEEPPFFQTDEMGSAVYARRARARGDQIVGMLSLETLGFYSDAAGSQRYPFPFSLFYPSAGNFIGFVGNRASSALVKRCVASFRAQVPFPSEGAALPEVIEGTGWSDHWGFWQVGYPALMVTDTAPFRYPHYHEPEDTIDKLDFERMARVVAGLALVIDELANAEEIP